MKLFVYGSLKQKSKLEYIIGRSWGGMYIADTLPDHVKVQVSWYPMIFEKVGESVEGLLITELGKEDFEGLDHYEAVDSGLFRRKTIYLPKNDTVAEVYYNGEGHKLEYYLSPLPSTARA